MRFLSICLALALVCAFSPLLQAAGKTTDASTGTKSIAGTVVKISGHKLTLTVTSKKGKTRERSVKVDDKTKITLDGIDAKLSDLKKDQQVTVKLEHRLATEIVATSAHTSGTGTASTGDSTAK